VLKQLNGDSENCQQHRILKKSIASTIVLMLAALTANKTFLAYLWFELINSNEL